MIFVELKGGLGNQMFQYAYGRSLSLKNKCRFYYFFNRYRGDTKRNYKLNIFNLKGKKICDFVPGILMKLSHFTGINLKYFISGYWQSEKYFRDYMKEIRNDFEFINKISGKNLSVLKRIINNNSISVHIRRGDYVSNKSVSDSIGFCGLNYYYNAIKFVVKKIDNPFFFIFSDDIQWAKENLKINHNVEYIDWNNNEDFWEDMRLMSFCKHNIIANSSFSWWGAWLNKNREKIVIAPKKWFNHLNDGFSDMIPKKWIKL